MERAFEHYEKVNDTIEMTFVIEYTGYSDAVKAALLNLRRRIIEDIADTNRRFVPVDNAGFATAPVATVSSTALTSQVVHENIGPWEDF